MAPFGDPQTPPCAVQRPGGAGCVPQRPRAPKTPPPQLDFGLRRSGRRGTQKAPFRPQNGPKSWCRAPKSPREPRGGGGCRCGAMEGQRPDAGHRERYGRRGTPKICCSSQRFIDSDAVAASAPDVAPDAAPDVALAAPNPAVPPAVSPGGGSDTDGEEVAPTPHIRSLRSRIRPRNPNAGSRAMSGGADVGQMNPKCGKSTPKRQSLAPEACGAGGVGGAAPHRQTDMESPKGSDGAQTPSRAASTMGSEAAAAPAPKSPDPAPNLGLAGAGQHRPNGDTDVTEGDTEAEGEWGGAARFASLLGHFNPLPDTFILFPGPLGALCVPWVPGTPLCHPSPFPDTFIPIPSHLAPPSLSPCPPSSVTHVPILALDPGLRALPFPPR